MFRTAAAPRDEFPPFRVDVEPERELVRVVPVGELDMETVGQLADQLSELREAGFTCLVLDLRRLRFIDSSGLHLILDADARARADGHDFALVPGPPAVQRVFDMVGICEHLRFRTHQDRHPHADQGRAH